MTSDQIYSLQKITASITMAVVFVALTGVLGYQVLVRIGIDTTLFGAWGIILGQYLKLLGVDTGSSIAQTTIATVAQNGFHGPPGPTGATGPAGPAGATGGTANVP